MRFGIVVRTTYSLHLRSLRWLSPFPVGFTPCLDPNYFGNAFHGHVVPVSSAIIITHIIVEYRRAQSRSAGLIMIVAHYACVAILYVVTGPAHPPKRSGRLRPQPFLGPKTGRSLRRSLMLDILGPVRVLIPAAHIPRTIVHYVRIGDRAHTRYFDVLYEAYSGDHATESPLRIEVNERLWIVTGHLTSGFSSRSSSDFPNVMC